LEKTIVHKFLLLAFVAWPPGVFSKFRLSQVSSPSTLNTLIEQRQFFEIRHDLDRDGGRADIGLRRSDTVSCSIDAAARRPEKAAAETVGQSTVLTTAQLNWYFSASRHGDKARDESPKSNDVRKNRFHQRPIIFTSTSSSTPKRVRTMFLHMSDDLTHIAGSGAAAVNEKVGMFS